MTLMECGVAMVRLLKPLEYYKEKYGKKVKIVEGSLNNRKLTSPEDFLDL